MNSTNMERVRYIDVAKGIGILLVIIGHTFPGSYVQRVCYSFHMPLFFFISGLCYNHSKYDFKRLWKIRMRQLLVPLLLFSVILYALRYALLRTTYFHLGLLFPDATWFLFVLFLAEMLGYFVIDKTPLVAILLGMISVILYHLNLCLPNSLSAVPIAIMYYCLGNKARKVNYRIDNKMVIGGGDNSHLLVG